MADPSPQLLAADLATFLKNGPIALKSQRKTYDDLTRDWQTHIKTSAQFDTVFAALAKDITRAVQSAKDKGMTGTKLGDFSADADVARLLRTIAELRDKAIGKHGASLTKLAKEQVALEKAVTLLAKRHFDEHAYQSKLGAKAKWVGFNKGKLEELKSLATSIERFGKEIARDLGKPLASLGDFNKAQQARLDKLVSDSLGATRTNTKLVDAAAFAKLSFDHARLTRNAASAKALFDAIVDTAKLAARYRQTGGTALDWKTLETALKAARIKQTTLAKIATLHGSEWQKLGKAGQAVMLSQAEGKKSAERIAQITDYADKSAKLVKALPTDEKKASGK